MKRELSNECAAAGLSLSTSPARTIYISTSTSGTPTTEWPNNDVIRALSSVSVYPRQQQQQHITAAIVLDS